MILKMIKNKKVSKESLRIQNKEIKTNQNLINLYRTISRLFIVKRIEKRKKKKS